MGTNDITGKTVQRALNLGVVKALIGSGWTLNKELIAERMQSVSLELLEVLPKFDSNRSKLEAYAFTVAFSKTVSFVKLHLHRHDGAMNRGTVDSTDATADDKAPSCITDESALSGFARTEQRMAMERAVERLTAIERSLFACIYVGDSEREWGHDNGFSPVQVNRMKADLIAKLARYVAE